MSYGEYSYGEVVYGEPTEVLNLAYPARTIAFVGTDQEPGNLNIEYPAKTFSVTGGGRLALAKSFAIVLTNESLAGGDISLSYPERLFLFRGGGRLSLSYPERLFSFRGGGRFALVSPTRSIAFTSLTLRGGDLTLTYPKRGLNLLSGEYTGGVFSLGYPGRSFSFIGAIQSSGDLAFSYPPRLLSFFTGATSSTVLVLNTDTMYGLTNYENFNFNSIVQPDNGDIYLASSSGLFKLTGITDNGAAMSASFETAESDFGSPYLKGMEGINLSLKGGPVTMQTFHDAVYSTAGGVLTSTANEFITRKGKPGRGLKQKYWGVKVSNSNGSSFEIDSMELAALILSRKIHQK